jgi:hypothetical protein
MIELPNYHRLEMECHLCSDKHCELESHGHDNLVRVIYKNDGTTESGNPYLILGCPIYKAKHKEKGK